MARYLNRENKKYKEIYFWDNFNNLHSVVKKKIMKDRVRKPSWHKEKKLVNDLVNFLQRYNCIDVLNSRICVKDGYFGRVTLLPSVIVSK